MKNLFLWILLSVFCAGCSKTEDNRDVIVVGTSADNPPYEYLENEKVVGIDIEVAKYIAKSLGKKLEIKNISFNTLIPALKIGDVDMVIAGLDKTAERAEQIDFSDTYYSTQMSFVCNQDELVNKMSDINGKKVGVLAGSTWEVFARNIEKKYSIQIRSLTNNLTIISELKTRNLDCAIFEDVQAKIFTKKNPDLGYYVIPDTKGNFVIGLAKRSGMLKDVNNAIAKMISEKQVETMVQKAIDKDKPN